MFGILGREFNSLPAKRKKNGKIVEVEIISHTLEFNGHNAKMILATEITKPARIKKKKK